MNREIKFRAWGKNIKEFLSPDGYHYGLTLKEIQNIEDIDLWEFQQFIGLLDKQGKEIYEGDIMSSEMGNGRITWIECSGKFVLEGDNFLINPWDGYEVIGNVFENKNLLTK